MDQFRTRERRHALPDRILGLVHRMYIEKLSGRNGEAARLRREAIRAIRCALEVDSNNGRLWCQLGDIYAVRQLRVECYRRALSANPHDSEAHAELCRLFAQTAKGRFGTHFDSALRYCHTSDVEESVIYAAMDGAKVAGQLKRKERARRIGARRFPDSSLFQKETDDG